MIEKVFWFFDMLAGYYEHWTGRSANSDGLLMCIVSVALFAIGAVLMAISGHIIIAVLFAVNVIVFGSRVRTMMLPGANVAMRALYGDAVMIDLIFLVYQLLVFFVPGNMGNYMADLGLQVTSTAFIISNTGFFFFVSNPTPPKKRLKEKFA